VDIPYLSPSEIEGLPRFWIRKISRHKANVCVIEIKGKKYVLKEVTKMPWILRVTLGRWLLFREILVYKKLNGIEGIPKLIARVGKDAILLTFEEGKPLRKETKPFIPVGFFDKLEALVNAIHERGIVHLDLGQRKNILVRKDGSPVILDFGSAVGASLPTPIGKILVKIFGWIDKRGLLMQRLRYGDGLNEKYKKALRRANLIRRFWIFNKPSKPTKI